LLDIGLERCVKNLLLVAGGCVGIYLAWLRVTAANLQAEAATWQAGVGRRAHFAELFTNAASQLSDERLQVRLAAIYTLREIGRDFADLGGIVFELLNAYLSSHKQVYPIDQVPPDIEEIVRILQQRDGP
jgi:hypothetical protein